MTGPPCDPDIGAQGGLRIKWMDEELEELDHYIGETIRAGRNVKEQEVREALEKSKYFGETLHQRKWTTVKAKVNYTILKKFRP